MKTIKFILAKINAIAHAVSSTFTCAANAQSPLHKQKGCKLHASPNSIFSIERYFKFQWHIIFEQIQNNNYEKYIYCLPGNFTHCSKL